MTLEITAELARWVADSDYSALPDMVRREAQRTFVNFIGCALGGCTHAAVATMLAMADEFSGPRQATVIGRSERLDPLNAALVNCMSSAVHTFDDTHLKSILHAGGPVSAAITALAERQPIGGPKFLHALTLGVEVACRLGNMLSLPPARHNVSLFMTGIVAGIGAAVASAKLGGRDADTIQRAIGIATAQSSGIREMHGTMCSSFVPGNASRAGLLAALLADRGFTTGPRSLEGPKGLGNVFGAPANPDAALDGLGTDYEILFNTYKPYPCGIAIHPAIDACLEIIERHRPNPDKIAHVDVTLHPVGAQLTGRTSPITSLEAQVSVPHWTAATFIHGGAGIPEGTTECVRDPIVIALRGRVAVTGSPALAPAEARMIVTMTDGSVFDSHIVHCRGSHERPLTNAELDQKFLVQAAPVVGDRNATELLARCWDIESTDDVQSIIAASAAPR
jgi:2-methylcitrate dehydratase PrpD